MAKAISTGPAAPKDIEGFSMSKGGAGWKNCPSCSGFVKGPLTKVCPNCKHEFQFKAKEPKGERQLSFPTVGVSNEVALFFILAQGGLPKAIKAVEAVQADPVLDFVCQCGGSAQAVAKLNLIAAKIGQ